MRYVLCCGMMLSFVARGEGQSRPSETPASLTQKAKAVLAQIEGEVRLPGLKRPVEVLRDRWGVPHIYAENADDLFFAQGFVAAQDRLFQLDWWRRIASGETAEIVGAQAVEADRFARLVRYRGDMDAEWRSYSPDTRQIAEAFTRGINACIDHIGPRLPIEFQILGIAPRKWRPQDVLGRMSGIVMSQNFRNEVARAQLVAAVGAERARTLAPTDPPRAYGPAPGLDLAGLDARVLAGYNAATRLLPFKPARTESNNWVLAGARSTSGKPLLASDPHRATALPSLRYLVHLHAPGWNVIGSGEPALPGVALGHNDHIAWGFTIVGTDQADIFVEEINPNNSEEYRVGERWERMKIEREEIRVKGKEGPLRLELRFTRHGPVLFQDAKTHRAYALKWSGSEPGGAAYLGSLAVGRARNQGEFLTALEAWKIPGLNFVYADMEGNIGWVAAALTPIRPKHDGLLPVPGSGGFEWQGYLPVRDLPQSFNPKQGWLGTANHNILPKDYKKQIAYEWAPPYRFERIRSVLDAGGKFDLKDFQKLQHDQKSLPGVALTGLLKHLDPSDRRLLPFLYVMSEWNGKLDRDSKAGPLYALWLHELQSAFYSPHVPKNLAATLRTLSGLPVMLRALESPDEKWFGKDPVAARDELLRTTFARAVARVQTMYPNLDKMRWGALHTVTFKHPLATLGPAYETAFNLGPVERGGDTNTPNNTRYDDDFKQIHGASYRHLFDLADWDRALATSAPGQSGQPGSPHYADLLPLWAEGEYFPLAFSRRQVEVVTRHRLWLKPE